MTTAKHKHPTTVLLFAEAVTLAHFARIMTLAKGLAQLDYHVIVASDDRFLHLEGRLPFPVINIFTIPSAQFAAALKKGEPLYDRKTLIRYVENDLEIIDAVKPDIIIGDFRLSLAISAPLRDTPYISIANAYWSPYAQTHYPIPDIPLTKLFGVKLAQRLFNLARPFVFYLHSQALNKVRRHFGLAPLGNDLRCSYTWANTTLYADTSELVPLINAPNNQQHIGPVLWSTKTALPGWWQDLPSQHPIIAICMGSSGDDNITTLAIQALASLPVTIIAAGKIHKEDLTSAPNIYTADYLPIDEVAAKANLLICNGGSLTCYQALSCGTPILGIANNMDQFLNMAAIEQSGAGLTLRASTATPQQIRTHCEQLLSQRKYRAAAEKTATHLHRYNSITSLSHAIETLLKN